MGGVRGVGVQFLDEIFNSNSTSPHYRVHKAAAKRVLRSLLPPVGSGIRGAARRRSQLRQDAECQTDSQFNDLMRILDTELHLVIPLQIDLSESDSNGHESDYQLTHDYLVPSIREWLNRDDKKTIAGRARRLLIDRAEAWRESPVARPITIVYRIREDLPLYKTCTMGLDAEKHDGDGQVSSSALAGVFTSRLWSHRVGIHFRVEQ